jgi:hypothetical protein
VRLGGGLWELNLLDSQAGVGRSVSTDIPDLYEKDVIFELSMQLGLLVLLAKAA